MDFLLNTFTHRPPKPGSMQAFTLVIEHDGGLARSRKFEERNALLVNLGDMVQRVGVTDELEEMRLCFCAGRTAVGLETRQHMDVVVLRGCEDGGFGRHGDGWDVI